MKIPGLISVWGLALWGMSEWAYGVLPQATTGLPFNTPDMTAGFRSGSMAAGFNS